MRMKNMTSGEQWLLQLEYLDVTVQEKLRSGWSGPFVKVEGCCD
jgi:hypothetical protein